MADSADNSVFIAIGSVECQPTIQVRQTIRKKRSVSRQPEQRFRNDKYGVSPGISASALQIWRRIRNVSVRFLGIVDILQPFAIKSVRIKRIERRRYANLAVSRVWEFFPMRTIGRYTHMHIGQLCKPKTFFNPTE